MGAEERTEEATPKRREEARKRGQVARTRELPSTLLILSALAFMYAAKNMYFQAFKSSFNYFLGNAHWRGTLKQAYPVSLEIISKLLFPLFLILLSVAVFSYVVQFGFLFSLEIITPKLDKLNPLNGIKNLFSKRALVELIKSAIKVIIVLWIAYPIIRDTALHSSKLFSMPPESIFAFILKSAATLILKVGIAFLFISLLDYGYQRWEHEQSLKMTKQEVKEELKQYEGDPQVKSRIRRIQRELARKRMMQEVPKADVVITNPVEIAVALKYDVERMNAPKVVAKGVGELAKRIREIARKNGVPIVENRPLARMLYKLVEVGEEIPEALYKAVAEVLAYVYKQKGKAA